MLETIREYALERADDDGRADELRDRHAAYFAGVADDRWEDFPGEGPLDLNALSPVERERVNVHAAADWSLTRSRVDQVHVGLARAWRILAAIDGYTNRYSEATTESERAMGHAMLGGEASIQCRSAIALAAALAFGPTSVDDGIQRCERFLSQVSGDPISEGSLLTFLALLESARASNGTRPAASAPQPTPKRPPERPLLFA